MSIVLVTFPGAPKPSDEAISKEAELESFLERRITGKMTWRSLYSLDSRNAIFNSSNSIVVLSCRTCSRKG